MVIQRKREETQTRAKEKQHKQEKMQSDEQRKKENLAKKIPTQRAKENKNKQEKRQKAKEEEMDCNVMIQSFKEACREVPVYICCICNRFHFRKQTVSFVLKKYAYIQILQRGVQLIPQHMKNWMTVERAVPNVTNGFVKTAIITYNMDLHQIKHGLTILACLKDQMFYET